MEKGDQNHHPLLGEDPIRDQRLVNRQAIKEQAAKFFGVTPAQDPLTAEQNTIVWQRRRFKHLNIQYGVKTERINPSITTPTRSVAGSDILGDIVNALPPEDGIQPRNKDQARILKAFSTEPKKTGLERKESVMKMAADTINNFVRGTPFRKTNSQTTNRPAGSFSLRSSQAFGTSCSFPKAHITSFPEAETSFMEVDQSLIDEQEEDVQPRPKKGLRRTDPQTFASIEDRGATAPLSRIRPDRLDLNVMHHPLERTTNVDTISELEERTSIPAAEDVKEVFYDKMITHKRPQFTLDGYPGSLTTSSRVAPEPSMMPGPFPVYPETPKMPMTIRDQLKEKEKCVNLPEHSNFWKRLRRSFRESFPAARVKSLSALIKSHPTKRPPTRRQFSSLPFAGSFKQKYTNPRMKKQLDDETYDERPFFTYWITCVQICVMLLALLRFGFGTTFSKRYFDVTERSGDVLAPSISQVHLVVYEQNNIWIGPSYADLVHMGAKYAPCMRRDRKILDRIEEERRVESEETGCCISAIGCFQTSDCARQFSKLVKFINDSRSNPPMIRGVCGQDPRFCKRPRSVDINTWSQDISQWPICEEIYQNAKLPDHMRCEIQGRPCCIQMHGQCRITTKEYCNFVKGYYHENATLCSQVSCLGDVCGMTPFMRRDHPDQFYRFVTPLFIHAGIIPCIVTVWIQFTYMRKFEIMIGWIRLSIIYFASGIGGYIASATFVPYMPQVGPSGAQMGILGAMVVNVIYNWKYLKNPVVSLGCHLIVAAFLFLLGILPFIDNIGQIFGFVIGALLAFALIPYLAVDKKLVLIIFSFITVVCLLIGLIILFYLDPEELRDLKWMSSISCVSLGSPRICDQQSLQLKDWLPI
ncbi:hypothetical protein FO519_002859 [Halicephalobus sp. NKZ332]|nr:hypothetical protein FO519_002859 [Halicephalobus sp. NKZ332]